MTNNQFYHRRDRLLRLLLQNKQAFVAANRKYADGTILQHATLGHLVVKNVLVRNEEAHRTTIQYSVYSIKKKEHVVMDESRLDQAIRIE